MKAYLKDHASLSQVVGGKVAAGGLEVKSDSSVLGVVHTWQKRWYVLVFADKTLREYKAEDAAHANPNQPERAFNLEAADQLFVIEPERSDKSAKKNRFNIVWKFPDAYELALTAPQEEFDAWVAAVTHVSPKIRQAASGASAAAGTGLSAPPSPVPSGAGAGGSSSMTRIGAGPESPKLGPKPAATFEQLALEVATLRTTLSSGYSVMQKVVQEQDIKRRADIASMKAELAAQHEYIKEQVVESLKEEIASQHEYIKEQVHAAADTELADAVVFLDDKFDSKITEFDAKLAGMQGRVHAALGTAAGEVRAATEAAQYFTQANTVVHERLDGIQAAVNSLQTAMEQLKGSVGELSTTVAASATAAAVGRAEPSAPQATPAGPDAATTERLQQLLGSVSELRAQLSSLATNLDARMTPLGQEMAKGQEDQGAAASQGQARAHGQGHEVLAAAIQDLKTGQQELQTQLTGLATSIKSLSDQGAAQATAASSAAVSTSANSSSNAIPELLTSRLDAAVARLTGLEDRMSSAHASTAAAGAGPSSPSSSLGPQLAGLSTGLGIIASDTAGLKASVASLLETSKAHATGLAALQQQQQPQQPVTISQASVQAIAAALLPGISQAVTTALSGRLEAIEARLEGLARSGHTARHEVQADAMPSPSPASKSTAHASPFRFAVSSPSASSPMASPGTGTRTALGDRMRDLRLQAVQLHGELSRLTGMQHVIVSLLPSDVKGRPDVLPLLAKLALVEDDIVSTRRAMAAQGT